jgi:hypothetical protein
MPSSRYPDSRSRRAEVTYYICLKDVALHCSGSLLAAAKCAEAIAAAEAFACWQETQTCCGRVAR